MSKLVLALGGNALGDTPEEQIALVRKSAAVVAELIEQGNEVIVCHGNGPQVGMIHRAIALAAETGTVKAAMPLPECGAMSQGYIGYHLQNSIQNELARRGVDRTATTVVTQMLVDPADPAFSAPTKPIGAFYSLEQAEKLRREKGFVMVEDSGRGYRQVVPSPKPVDVIEKEAIRRLCEAGQVVVACGGGGIPVVRGAEGLQGVEAVIDKDLAAAKLAELVGAEVLVILTAVERVAIRFGTPEQRFLDRMDLEEAQRYVDAGEFAPGSMLPKVLSAMSFARGGGRAIIGALEKAGEALRGESGTLICR